MKGGIYPDFHIPTEIFIKQDLIADIGNIISQYGQKFVLITTSSDFEQFSDVIETIASISTQHGIGCIIYDEIPENPDTEYIDSAVYFTKKSNCDIIVGFGGIESINSAKAVSLLTNNNLFCKDLFDVDEVNKPIPLITIPTQPIFGFEILPLFFITEIRNFTKNVYSNRYLFPKTTIIDPKISTILDDETTANSGISSLSIATESVISNKSNDLINTYALKSIDLIFKNLLNAYRDPKDPAPRHQLAVASIMSGFAFSITGLSISLSLSLALSSRIEIPIARLMGLILPHVMEYNLTVSSGKYVQMSKVMDENIKDITVIEAAIKAVEGVRKLEIDVEIPQRLSQFDFPKTELTRVAEIAFRYPFIENAPRPLSRDEIETILIAAY
ncbi:MAG: iron-containing alcohol dehydrogenase [Spirochaetota bacterium]|nr:iron-containing alcohol dehydrogenase [Spirochaetota bacterium]